MKTQPHKTERIHSLDSLRAIMMLLGLVLHSALTYSVTDFGDSWSLKDTSATHLSNDVISYLIHTFRMPIFFLVAGFFGAMLFYERKPLKMIKNRGSRILYPFIVFVILLWPTIVFTFKYTKLIFAGNNNAFAEIITYFSNPLIFIPQNTFHLWFLYYLTLITAASVLLAIVFKRLPNISENTSKAFNWLIQKPIGRVLFFTSLTCIVYLILGTAILNHSTSFILDFNTFFFFFFFYIVGWILFKSKHLLDCLMRLDWVCTILGLLLSMIYVVNRETINDESIIILSSFIVWLFIFGITGLFIRYGSTHSSVMRYVSDSSYWVYLIHLPLTAIIPSFIVDWPIPATLKFLFVLLITTIICFVSYHYLVRGSFIGNFLNGRKYSKKLSDITKAQELSQLKPILNK